MGENRNKEKRFSFDFVLQNALQFYCFIDIYPQIHLQDPPKVIQNSQTFTTSWNCYIFTAYTDPILKSVCIYIYIEKWT